MTRESGARCRSRRTGQTYRRAPQGLWAKPRSQEHPVPTTTTQPRSQLAGKSAFEGHSSIVRTSGRTGEGKGTCSPPVQLAFGRLPRRSARSCLTSTLPLTEPLRLFLEAPTLERIVKPSGAFRGRGLSGRAWVLNRQRGARGEACVGSSGPGRSSQSARKAGQVTSRARFCSSKASHRPPRLQRMTANGADSPAAM